MMRAVSVYASLCLLAVCLTFPSGSRANENCFPYKEHFAIAQAHPNVQGTRELTAEEVAKVVAFAGIENDMSVNYDTGYLALMMDNSVRFVFGASGHVCTMLVFPAHLVPALVEVLVGRPA